LSSAEDKRFFRRRIIVTVVVLLLTLVATYMVTARLRLDPNVATLLPERGESAALRLYLKAFGGSDLAMVLVSRPAEAEGEGEDDDAAVAEVEAVARGLAKDLQALDEVKVAAAAMSADGKLDPLMVWRHADPPARKRLAAALTPEGMRVRLRGSRSLLLAPGAGAISEQIARDPLRLQQLLYDEGAVGSGFRTQADGSFASDDGRARLVLVFPKGQALRGDDAKAFVYKAREVLDGYRREHPKLYLGLTGGHAIAEATEAMLMRDLTLSSTISMLLASLAFAFTFRRLRALGAVIPPLFVGTVWTAAIAAMMPGGLSAIAVAFMSVVIGVGVDTGVHVYAALLEARNEGLSPRDAARVARQKTQRPVMVAAITAGAAFGSLVLSEIGALRQLGILCAGGEVLTAMAIVVITPEIGAYLERKKPPKYVPPRWTHWIGALTHTRARSIACLLLATAPVLALAAGYTPELADAIVAMRPKGLQPLDVQQRIYDDFGGRAGQWVVMVADADREKARARADQVAEKLATVGEHIDSLDAITAIAPAPPTQLARLKERDAFDLPAKASELERALIDEKFAPARFEAVLSSWRNPPHELISLEAMQQSDNAIMLSRYLGEADGKHIVVLYLLPRLEPLVGDMAASAAIEERNHQHAELVEQAVHEADPDAMLTGYGRLDSSLKESLRADMPRIGLVAALLVLLALAASLRRPRDVALAMGVVIAEMAVVLFLIRALDVPLHAYDALVLPVLLGITVDEGMFLLYRARESGSVRETLEREGPPVATTALTTAAGFGGLLVCDFDGLRHLGMVGAIGSLTGLLVALIVVPAGLRLSGVPARGPAEAAAAGA
jgi:predicted RND superfamily exporter protein